MCFHILQQNIIQASLPVALKYAVISLDKRILTRSLTLSLQGRPTLRKVEKSFTSYVSGSASIPALIASSSSSVGRSKILPDLDLTCLIYIRWIA
jgi:hypothetical protein